MSRKMADRIGETYANLKVLDFENRKTESGRVRTFLYCECLKCGNKKWIHADSVLYGKQKNCGCRSSQSDSKFSGIPYSRSSTGVRGVYFAKDVQKYTVSFHLNGEGFRMSGIPTLDEAAALRKEAERRAQSDDFDGFKNWFSQTAGGYKVGRGRKKTKQEGTEKEKQKESKKKKPERKKSSLSLEEYRRQWREKNKERVKEYYERRKSAETEEDKEARAKYQHEYYKKRKKARDLGKQRLQKRTEKAQIHVGEKHGKLEVIGMKVVDRRLIATVRCECDTVKDVRYDHLVGGNIVSCGCAGKKNQFEAVDITKQRFGKLIAIRPIEQKKSYSGAVMWECECDCGNTVNATVSHLKQGRVTSCGCVGVESARENVKKALAATDDFIKDGTNYKLIEKTKPNRDNTSGHRNIQWDKARGKWLVTLDYKRKSYLIGRFDDIDIALITRDAAREARSEGRFEEWIQKYRSSR